MMNDVKEMLDDRVLKMLFKGLESLSKDLFVRRATELQRFYGTMLDNRIDCIVTIFDAQIHPAHYNPPPLLLNDVTRYMIYREARFLLDCETDALAESAVLDHLWSDLHKQVVSRAVRPSVLVDMMLANQVARSKIQSCRAHAYSALEEILGLINMAAPESNSPRSRYHIVARRVCEQELGYVKGMFDGIIADMHDLRTPYAS